MMGSMRAKGSKDRRPLILVGALAFVVFSVVLVLNVLQVQALYVAKGSDQTYLYESLASTVDGSFFHQTHSITNLGGWGKMDHFWPVMLLFVPFAVMVQSVHVLGLINAISLTAAGLVFFLIARDLFGNSWLGVLAAVTFWTMPEVYYSSITGNWPEVWALPYLIAMFLFHQRRQPVPFAISAILFMACMEQMLVYVVLFMVLELLSRREKLWLILPLVLAGFWIVVLGIWAEGFAAGRFFTHHFDLSWERLSDFFRSLYLDLNRSPLLYLAAIWPPFFLFALFPALIVLGWGLRLDLVPGNEGHLRYAFFIFYFMAVGGIYGIRTLASFVQKRWGWPARRVVTVVLTAVLVVHVAALFRMAPAEAERYETDEETEFLWRVAEGLPKNARIASNCVMSYLFVGRASAYVEFARVSGPQFRLWEFFFDQRNLPKNEWLAKDRYQAMGRHTPSAFILKREEGDGFRVEEGLWADPRRSFTRARCWPATDQGGAAIEIGGEGGGVVTFKPRSPSGLDFEEDDSPTLTSSERVGASLKTREVNLGLPLDTNWHVEIEPDRQAVSLHISNDVENRQVTHRFGGYLEEMLFVDLNMDDRLDVIVVDSQRYLMWILLGIGEGQLELQPPVPAPPIPQSVAATDLDGDGTVEIIFTKTQVIPDVNAFERFLDHEKIDHLLWDLAGGNSEISGHFDQRPGWSREIVGDVVHFTRVQHSE